MNADLIARSSLGAWANDDLNRTARENAGIGADEDLPPAVRFLGGVTKLVRRRIAVDNTRSDPVRLAIFLLQPSPQARASAEQSKRIPMLDNGLTFVTGRLWFVGAAVMSGKYFELGDEDDNAIFETVTVTLGVGNIPTVIFDPRTSEPTIRFYPHGLGSPDICNVVSMASIDVSVEFIFEQIEMIYRKEFITPDAQVNAGKLWDNSRKWWPSSHAEDMVQLYLKVGLSAALPWCTVRHEQPDVVGRLDLEIESCEALDRSKVTRHAILELKVLRSLQKGGTPVSDQAIRDWVESGVKQAAAYRDKRGAKAAALCCFDMQRADTGDQCFDHVRDLATRLAVEMRRWFVFNSSKQFRDSIV